MTRTTRWSPVSLGLGVWMIWCVVAVAITTIGRSLAEVRELFSVPMVALLLAAGLLAVVGGGRPSQRIAAALGVAALALPIATVASFGDRGIVGAVGVGLVLAGMPAGAALGSLKQQSDLPLSTPDFSPSVVARFGCALVGAGMVLVFGTPVVHAWLRGVAPYDLWALSPSTFVERFAETAPILLGALGIAALAAVVLTNKYLPLVSAAMLTCLIASAVMQIDASSSLFTALRLVILGGGGVMVTVLIWVAVLARPREVKIVQGGTS